MNWFKPKPKQEKTFAPYTTRCMYCNRPFSTYTAQSEHEKTCAEETQRRLDAEWFSKSRVDSDK